MPLFRKIIFALFLILLFAFGFYYVLFTYLKEVNLIEAYDLKDVTNILQIGSKYLKEACIYLYNAFIDTIVFYFSFSWKEMPTNIACYFIFIGITAIPTILFFIRFLTYRGFKAFKLTIKKAKANPFYYDDWKKAIKFSTYDNINDVLPFGIQCIVFTARIVFMLCIIVILPILVFLWLLLELLGILKGLTNTGRANDFD